MQANLQKTPIVSALKKAYISTMAIIATGAVKADKPEKLAPASKFIGEIAYDPKERTMDITFKSGTKVRYLDVSPVTFLSFKQSPTIDSYYSRAIKGNLESVKLVDAGIGRQKSAPLKKITEVNNLDTGLRKQQTRKDRIAGTVARAFAVV